MNFRFTIAFLRHANGGEANERPCEANRWFIKNDAWNHQSSFYMRHRAAYRVFDIHNIPNQETPQCPRLLARTSG